MALDAIVPYWRNPRHIPDDAVNALVSSIQRYGYQQPIVVDPSLTIIIGHTRYAALRRMGVAQVPVIVADLPADKAKQLRVLDNRAQEFTSWNYEDLMAELTELDRDLMRSFFPEVGALVDDTDAIPTPPDPDAPQKQMWDEVDSTAEFICPSCFHTFEIEVTLEKVQSGVLRVPATEGAKA